MLKTIGSNNSTKMDLFISAKWFKIKNQEKACIFSTRMIFTLEAGQKIIWKVMDLISLLQVRFMKGNLKKDLSKDMVNAFMKMEDNMKAHGLIILKLVWEKYPFLIKSYLSDFSSLRLKRRKGYL